MSFLIPTILGYTVYSYYVFRGKVQRTTRDITEAPYWRQDRFGRGQMHDHLAEPALAFQPDRHGRHSLDH